MKTNNKKSFEEMIKITPIPEDYDEKRDNMTEEEILSEFLNDPDAPQHEVTLEKLIEDFKEIVCGEGDDEDERHK